MQCVYRPNTRGKVKSEVTIPGSSEEVSTDVLGFTHSSNKIQRGYLSAWKTLHADYQLTESHQKHFNRLYLKVQTFKKEFKNILKSARFSNLLKLGARLLHENHYNLLFYGEPNIIISSYQCFGTYRTPTSLPHIIHRANSHHVSCVMSSSKW